jgi:all-trans-retinol 13,14-reductase
MTDFDTIIIGSGAGGLSAALCLARAGQKVAVFEQHYVPGGWSHSFYLKGQRFSPGVHYIGLVDKGASTSNLYEGLGIANDLVFFRMNPEAYEHCWIGDERIDMPAGITPLGESLGKRFPLEKKGIQKYLKTVRTVSQQLQLIPNMKGFWDNLTIPFRTDQLGKYGLFSLKRVIGWHVKDPLLKAVLNVQCGDHGLPPGKASFPLHCAVMDHYFDGGFYPMGGGGAIVKAMTTVIKKHHGEIRTGQGVAKILVEGKKNHRKAVGIELSNGEKYTAKNIISNADPAKTFIDMVGGENLSEKLNKSLAKTRYSVTSLILFVTVDMDVKAAGFDSGNIWMMREMDMDKLFEDMSVKDILTEDEFPGVFISCTTLKDPVSFNGRYHNFEVVTFLDYSFFEQHDSKEKRTALYLEHKERLSQKLLNSLAKALPGVRDHVVQMELGTPMTNEFFVNSTRGNVYGTEKSFDQTGPFSFNKKTEIDNLYLCGASVMSHGVAGASSSGVSTAACILGCDAQDLLKPQENQNIRIYDAENEANWPAWIHQKRADKIRSFKAIDL